MLKFFTHKLDESLVSGIFNEYFYKMVYKNQLGKKKPIEHFISNYKSLKFDPSPEISLKSLCRTHNLDARSVVNKLSDDKEFYNNSRAISNSVLKHFSLSLSDKQLKEIKIASAIVDEKFYNQHYPDMGNTWLSPYLHYCLFGIKEFRKPTAIFDTQFYIEEYEDVIEQDLNPFVHYYEFGNAEDRFQNPDEKEKARIELEQQRVLEQATHFDADYYLSENLDVKDAGVDPYLHYIESGESEGRRPNPLFCPSYYLEKNPDVAEAGLPPFKHFVEFGAKEHREYSPKPIISELSTYKAAQGFEDVVNSSYQSAPDIFDNEYYLKNNPDVATAGIDPYAHYSQSGEQEGRKPNALFSPDFYKKLNADVRAANISPFEHFCNHGIHEDRLGIQPSIENRSSQQKPLLFVGHDGIQAGSEIVLLEIIKWFYNHTRRKLKVLLLSPGPVANMYAEFADVYVLPEYKVDDAKALSTFISEDFEFCYINTVVAGLLFDFLETHNISLDCDLVAHIHEMEKVIAENINSFENLKKHCNHFISASPATTKTLIETHELLETDITTVPAFIKIVDPDLANLDTLKNKMREEFSIPKDALVVGGCGTLYWRKGPDIFLESARQVLQNSNDEIHFVWIGPGPDLDELVNSLTEEEASYIHFVGGRTDANEAIAVADIFYMSSREDPFPLVVMESAQHCIPTICFTEATGIIEFVKDDAGICIDLIDANKGADAILMLAEQRDLITEMGRVARDRVTSNYTSEIQCLNIFQALQKYTTYLPSVTVIVPMYNHEKFIDERIQTILNQEIKDIEVIVLDDCSKDNSVAVALKYESDFRLTVTTNIKNTGSPFAQWKKGLSKAQAEVVWIAEGDDACVVSFIKLLLPYFDDEMVNIASGRTIIMNEEGIKNPTALEPYLDSAYQDKYKSSFVIDGFDEVNQNFGAVCTLVNASGLLIRKNSVDLQILENASSYKMCGDWLIYLSSLRGGKLAYDITTNNYFRRHSASVVNKVEGTDVYFNERYKISEFVFNNYNVTDKLVRRSFDAIDGEWDRFKYKHEGKSLSDLYDKSMLKSMVSIQHQSKHVGLYVHGMLFSKGGIERLAADLANYFVEQGLKVTIYARSWGKDAKPVYSLYENIQVKGIFDETQQEASILNLRKSLLDDEVDVFIPMLSEWLFTPIVEAAKHTGIPVIASEHNDPWKIEELWWNNEERLKCFEGVDHIHLLLNKFSESLPVELQSKVSIIPNGIELPVVITPYDNRQKLIVGIGRLAEQKRFDRLIEAAALIKQPLLENNWRIEIYGEGHLRSELEELIKELDVADLVSLKGVTNNIDAVLNEASINVMPSEFEGFGIALVEAMAHGLPSIAFKECNGPNEIITHKTGVLVDSVASLSESLELLIKNPKKRTIMSKNSVFAAKQYEKKNVFPKWIEMINKF
jgi:glycosyltransferase involved in cell wall biosynthesis